MLSTDRGAEHAVQPPLRVHEDRHFREPLGRHDLRIGARSAAQVERVDLDPRADARDDVALAADVFRRLLAEVLELQFAGLLSRLPRRVGAVHRAVEAGVADAEPRLPLRRRTARVHRVADVLHHARVRDHLAAVGVGDLAEQRRDDRPRQPGEVGRRLPRARLPLHDHFDRGLLRTLFGHVAADAHVDHLDGRFGRRLRLLLAEGEPRAALHLAAVAGEALVQQLHRIGFGQLVELLLRRECRPVVHHRRQLLRERLAAEVPLVSDVPQPARGQRDDPRGDEQAARHPASSVLCVRRQRQFIPGGERKQRAQQLTGHRSLPRSRR